MRHSALGFSTERSLSSSTPDGHQRSVEVVWPMGRIWRYRTASITRDSASETGMKLEAGNPRAAAAPDLNV
jgi:hypothetical protein